MGSFYFASFILSIEEHQPWFEEAVGANSNR